LRFGALCSYTNLTILSTFCLPPVDTRCESVSSSSFEVERRVDSSVMPLLGASSQSRMHRLVASNEDLRRHGLAGQSSQQICCTDHGLGMNQFPHFQIVSRLCPQNHTCPRLDAQQGSCFLVSGPSHLAIPVLASITPRYAVSRGQDHLARVFSW